MAKGKCAYLRIRFLDELRARYRPHAYIQPQRRHCSIENCEAFCNRALATCLAALVIIAAAAVFPASAQAQTVIDEWTSVKVPPPPALKEVVIDPKQTALLTMDFNKKTCIPAKRARCANDLPKVREFLDKARSSHMTVVNIYSAAMSKDDMAIAALPGEKVIQASLNKFDGSDLEQYLKAKGIHTVVITGTSANGAVLYSVGGAAMRGFKVIVPVDGMPADAAYQEQFTAWEIANAPTVSGASTLTKWAMIKFEGAN